uniref:Peptidase M20 dimerisation domain-containing protein n=1 Tax=Pyramimonas obovata TaxID=1411642 RepID=A0A6T7WP88_9CHLO|mmetsp:Transcript_26339/g.57178  ORF Transcript_26339/g.57178 Transcript_26339/m.57178 type:complete len:442 (+) Transcript_26339:192-1517(+)|eukprot:CAMPEP_0118930242 /NCGR_PEP_ID=MMETSP1169-20130426/6991_1 /TAXON_ID=36882 /ORGANISM="Pyramimonas obovata, Strain CCMP722" /LENGTH=441 /DNA_ID=CAMNT_0006872565 /DNA_START=166 /DNA_END=1491 /DNA_ORIENTATION=-
MKFTGKALVFGLLALCVSARASSVLDEANAIGPWITELRREFHQIPELMYEEVKTSALIRKTLDGLGINYTHPIAITGVVAEIGQGSPVVALRADFDALPLDELTEVDFKSTHEGRMHACGHDAHTSMLLGAARLLKAQEASLQGTVRLLFQPAEEGGAGGRRMLKEGALGDAGAIFGIHTTPGFGDHDLPLGHIGTNSATLMAAAGSFDTIVHGRGGHAAAPHQTADPIVAAAALVQALQPIVARKLDPADAGVVSVTYVHAGHTNNVIPDQVTLGGTYRALTHSTFAWIKEQVRTVSEASVAAYGCTVEIKFQDGDDIRLTANGQEWKDYPYPPTINQPALTEFVRKVSEGIVGKEAQHFNEKAVMGGEDFSFYAEAIPGCFIFLGHASEGCTAPNHSPHFKVDEKVLPIGTALYTAFARQWLDEAAAKGGTSIGKQEL